MEDFWKDAEIISRYTRAQAIEDGVLVDLMQPPYDELMKQARIRFPVAMTATAFSQFVWPIENPKAEAWLKKWCQDPMGRAWDVLWMLRCSIGRASGDTLLYELHVRDWESKRLRKLTLKAVCGPGDDAEPVVTLMLPEED